MYYYFFDRAKREVTEMTDLSDKDKAIFKRKFLSVILNYRHFLGKINEYVLITSRRSVYYGISSFLSVIVVKTDFKHFITPLKSIIN